MQERPIIVGAGPAGLTLAWLLRKQHPIILEKASQIGGCHSVRRVDGKFSEHGPRVYSSNYVTTAKLLNDLGADFESLFTPYKFSPASIGGKTIGSLRASEIFQLAITYTLSIINPQRYKNYSMQEYCKDFSPETIEYFDRMCRLTDGAGLSNYSVYKFLQLVNQNFGYQFYQPKQPNDEGLFKIWGEALLREGVEIILNANVERLIFATSRQIAGVEATVNGRVQKYQSSTVILAVPPNVIGNLCEDGSFTPASGRSLKDWVKDNSYIDYCTVTFHWKDKLNIDSVWGFPATEWGIASVVLSDYFTPENTEGTIISVGITNVDAPVEIRGTKKTARSSSDTELIEETFRQLRKIYTLPQYDSAIIGSRIGAESAYIQSSQDPSILPSVGKVGGLYNAGTQNGESQYSFTSMETAVVNAVSLANKLGGEYFSIETQWTLNSRILFAVVILLVILVYFAVRHVPTKHTPQGNLTLFYDKKTTVHGA